MLLSVQISFAQVFTIEKIVKNDSAYQFPKIQSMQRPGIAKKINSIILTNFGVDPTVKNPYDSISNEDEYYYELGGVNERVLGLIVTGSHTGAGYHVTRNLYNLDARTGAPIDLNQLFGSDGQAKLRKATCKRWKESIKASINDASQGEEYKNCLAQAQTMTELNIDRMLVMDQGIKLWGGSCLDGSNYEYNKATGPYEFSFGQLLPMLTPYGYSLFVEKPSTGAVQTLLRGTIDNKYPISLTLLPGSAGKIGGMIVYDRVGGVINLNGTMNGNQFAFHELDESNNPISDINVKWDGSKLTGTFMNLKAKKQMPFVATPVENKK
jgi:hypothetical protein